MVTRDELLSTLDAATCTENRNVAGTQSKEGKNHWGPAKRIGESDSTVTASVCAFRRMLCLPHTHTHTHTRAHALTRTRTRARTRTDTHTHTHTLTQQQQQTNLSLSLTNRHPPEQDGTPQHTGPTLSHTHARTHAVGFQSGASAKCKTQSPILQQLHCLRVRRQAPCATELVQTHTHNATIQRINT